MDYNINFCIISAAYLSVTAYFYRRQARIPNRRSIIFDAMLWCGICSLTLDIVAAAIDKHAYLWPTWAVYLINIVFLLSVQTSGALFFFYSISLTGTYRRMNRWLRAVILLPYAFAAALLFASPFTTGGAFYLDEKNVYHHGGLHLALYAIAGLYLTSSLIIVLVRRRRLQKLKFFTILAFLLATVIAMLVQMSHPYLLVNTTANAFALVLIYHILEAPSSHVDALTGTLNRTALGTILHDVFDEGERCTLLVYALRSLHLINHSFGIKGGDAALTEFADYLKKEYPKRNILRTEGDVFCVLLTGGEYIDAERLDEISRAARSSFEINDAEVTLETSLAAINSEDCASADELTSLLERIMKLHRVDALGAVQLADGEFKQRLLRTEAIEKATERAMDEGRVQVYFQPIHDAGGRLCAMEALVRIIDPEHGFLPPQELIELAERNGGIIRLGEQVLRRTCEFIRDYGVALWGLDHVGVNLSAMQCVRDELPDEVERIVAEYGVNPELLAFEITETAAGALASVRQNMEALADKGIFFMLDDFGTGYANFKNLSALPYRCIKLDKSLLWNASNSKAQMMLLSGVIKVVRALGLDCLCEGVETEEQAELVRALGVTMMQGYYFSKPLPAELLAEYAGKEAAR